MRPSLAAFSVSAILSASERCSSCSATVLLQIPVALLLLLVALCAYYYKRSTRRVYLLDFACYKPPTSLQITTDMFLWGSKKFASVRPCAPLQSLRRVHSHY